MMIKKILLAVALFTLSLPVLAEGNAQTGQEKASRCQGCHGAEGKSKVPRYPNLAGQNADYLAYAMRAYQKGERSGGQAELMKAFVAGVKDEDIEDLAAWYAGLKP